MTIDRDILYARTGVPVRDIDVLVETPQGTHRAGTARPTAMKQL